MSDILFRRLAPSDVATYRNIRLESLKNDPDNYGSTCEEESKSPQLVFEKYILEQTPGNRMYGLFDGDKLIGISGFFGDTRQRVLHRAKVTQVYLDPAYRGQGLAKRLLVHLIEEAFKIESLESLQLEAVDSNKTAVGLYMSLGFVSYGLFENYFKKLDGTYLDQQFMVLVKGNSATSRADSTNK